MKGWIITLAIALWLAAASADKRPFTVDDLHALSRVGDFAVSSKGDIVFTLRKWDAQTDKATTNLQVLTRSANGFLPARELTSKLGVADSNPVFSPDGSTVLFLSSRWEGDGSAIYSVPVTGHEADVTVFASFPVEISNLKFAPNGAYITFTADVSLDCPQKGQLSCTADKIKEQEKKGTNTGYLFTSLYIRHWDTYASGLHSHIFKLNVKQVASVYRPATAEPLDVMFGLKASSPVPPFGGVEQYSISPKGDSIAFTAEMIKTDTAWTTDWKLFLVPISAAGAGTPVCITNKTNARTQNPVFSADGKLLAYAAMDRPVFEADRLHIEIYDVQKGGDAKKLAYEWDRSVGGMRWTPDGHLMVDAEDDAATKVFVVDVNTGRVAVLVDTASNDNAIFHPSSSASQYTFIVSRNSMTAPADLWSFTYSPKSLVFVEPKTYTPAAPVSPVKGTQLTSVNADLLSQVWIGTPQKFQFTGAHGDQVHGWIMMPYGYSLESSKDWPAAQLVHGGPQGSWVDDWSYRWNPQLYASRGYVVYFINFHGSTGYGQAFTDSISTDWGGAPFIDIMKGTDYVLENYPWIDRDRVCSLGASYGGYMINWIHGQTNRFKCLVVHDGMFDTFDSYYRTEELWFPEHEFGSVPWENPDVYDKWNPRRFVANWQTPTLVIHGGKDYRLPDTGTAVFTALQRRGIPSEYLYFPEENHWVLRPKNGILWYTTVLNWLDRWTNNSPAKH